MNDIPNANPASPTERIAGWLIRWRYLLLAIGVALTVAAYFPAQRLDFDRSVENMFAPDDPLLTPYRQLKRTFGGNEVVVAAYVDPQLMTPEGIERVAQLTKQLQDVKGVQSVLSLTSTPVGLKIIDDNTLSRNFLALLENYAVGDDRQTAAVVCMLQPNVASDERRQTIERLETLVRRHDPSGVLAGEPVMVVEGFRLIEEDGKWLGAVSTVLLMLAIVLCFRSLRWVIVPLAVVNATLLMTEGLLVVCQLQLSMVSSMLWAIVTVVGIATVIHILVHFRELREQGLGPQDSLRLSLAVLLVPVLWTCCTDAAGFASLLCASVGPVRDFGVMMTLGSLLALVGLALLLPGLALAGPAGRPPRRAFGETVLEDVLRRLMNAALRWPKTVALSMVSLAALSGLGCMGLEVETDFTKNFRADSSLVKSYELVESRLRGAGVWDVIVPAPKSPSLAFLDRLRRLERRLHDEVHVTDANGAQRPGLTKTLSLADALDALPDSAAVFFSAQRVLDIKVTLFRSQMPSVAAALYGEDPDRPGEYFARIMLRSRERQPADQKQQLIAAVRRISREEFPAVDGREAAQVTGFFVLLANIIESMIRDQWVTFGVATCAIWVMMTLAFRSPVLATVALIPNILPILAITGLMGWLNMLGWREAKINMGAAMIAAVSVGLAIDSSIHYISALRRLQRQGQTFDAALEAVQQSVGRAASFSTLALIVGFSALCFSDFIPIVYFGVLVSLAMFGGLVGNLVLLPLLLRFVARRAFV